MSATQINGSVIGPATLYPGASTPATPGETIVLYAKGFGPTSTPVTNGSVSQSRTLSPLPVITMGGVPATVAFAGLVAPRTIPVQRGRAIFDSGWSQPITATYNGLTTQAGTAITIQH